MSIIPFLFNDKKLESDDYNDILVKMCFFVFSFQACVVELIYPFVAEQQKNNYLSSRDPRFFHCLARSGCASGSINLGLTPLASSIF